MAHVQRSKGESGVVLVTDPWNGVTVVKVEDEYVGDYDSILQVEAVDCCNRGAVDGMRPPGSEDAVIVLDAAGGVDMTEESAEWMRFGMDEDGIPDNCRDLHPVWRFKMGEGAGLRLLPGTTIPSTPWLLSAAAAASRGGRPGSGGAFMAVTTAGEVREFSPAGAWGCGDKATLAAAHDAASGCATLRPLASGASHASWTVIVPSTGETAAAVFQHPPPTPSVPTPPVGDEESMDADAEAEAPVQTHAHLEPSEEIEAAAPEGSDSEGDGGPDSEAAALLELITRDAAAAAVEAASMCRVGVVDLDLVGMMLDLPPGLREG
jgi:hypothetical protein